MLKDLPTVTCYVGNLVTLQHGTDAQRALIFSLGLKEESHLLFLNSLALVGNNLFSYQTKLHGRKDLGLKGEQHLAMNRRKRSKSRQHEQRYGGRTS